MAATNERSLLGHGFNHDHFRLDMSAKSVVDWRMAFDGTSVISNYQGKTSRWLILLFSLAIQTVPLTGMASLPVRLILLVDGVSYRDMKALQEGMIYKDGKGRNFERRAFDQSYFPVSRLVSTFPSISDPAWTEILGKQPLAGYQRTYFNTAEGSEIFNNGLTSSMDFERQVHWRMEGSFRRVMSYILPQRAFKYEVKTLVKNFLSATNGVTNFYAMIYSTDVAQHLSGDIFSMLETLDAKLQKLRATYRAQEGRELEILILSDHGNNKGGNGKRVNVRGFLKKAGYQISKKIRSIKDVVLPTAGIESWIEIHNAPSETENLVRLLATMKGVDVVTALSPEHADQFIVMNAQGGRAVIEWNEANNSFRYVTESGDPLDYLPVIQALKDKGELDSNGFAAANSWMKASMDHRYPVALERIVRAHTRITLNPATILVSLKNDYVHCDWLIRRGIALVKAGGTHGGLDSLNSNGILLSTFAPTQDTSTSHVATIFEGFPGLRDPEQKQNIELVRESESPSPKLKQPLPLRHKQALR